MNPCAQPPFIRLSCGQWGTLNQPLTQAGTSHCSFNEGINKSTETSCLILVLLAGTDDEHLNECGLFVQECAEWVYRISS